MPQVFSLDYRNSFGTALDLIEKSARLMSFFLPGHEMQEAQNKLEAFRLFAYADRELNLPATHAQSLNVLVNRAMTLGNFPRIWALEGVAHHYTNSAGLSGTRNGLLVDADVPDCTMVSMHAGMGTSFAGKLLSNSGAQPSKQDLRKTIGRFLELCHANARPGWYENAIEPLGLAVRTLHPHLLAPVSDAIAEIDINARRLFWHGVGRSLYFVPTNFVTAGNAHARALRSAVAEAPTPEDRHNAVAGLVWAITLVNIRHTTVLKNVLRASESLRMDLAVKNGIVSAFMVWKHMVPEDTEYLPAYSSPAPGSGRDVRLWNQFVVEASARAFQDIFPALARQGRIASLFQYREF